MGNVDGWITISTKLENSQLEKDIKETEKELRKYEKEEEVLVKQKAKIDLSDYDAERAKIKANTDILLKKAETQEQVERILAREEIKLDQLGLKYDEQARKIDEINGKLKLNSAHQSDLNAKITQMNSKLAKSKGYEKIESQVKNLSTETGKVIGKVAKWALALLSIRTAYSLIQGPHLHCNNTMNNMQQIWNIYHMF